MRLMVLTIVEFAWQSASCRLQGCCRSLPLATRQAAKSTQQVQR